MKKRLFALVGFVISTGSTVLMFVANYVWFPDDTDDIRLIPVMLVGIGGVVLGCWLLAHAILLPSEKRNH